ncbi:MAG: hypothetical protein ABSB35_20035 [Bryobacteraceae bacterium]
MKARSHIWSPLLVQLHSAPADLLRRKGSSAEAAKAYERRLREVQGP